MKFARTIRLDVSDANVFPNPAEPGEWALTGTFAFVDQDPADWSNKDQLAFRSGWMGVESFGRSTFVQVAVIPEEHYADVERKLAAHIFEAYGAPDMLAALQAAKGECADMAALCDHPAGTLLSIERSFTDEGGIAEKVRALPQTGDENHARIWTFEEEGDETS